MLVVASFWTGHRNAITAAATVLVAFVLAQLVDRAVSRRAGRIAGAVAGDLSPVTSTRLRLVRRLLYASIIVIGVALALAQFAAVKRVATGVLASSAVLGLVVGFAARQTLANAVAGVLLAITQPIRIGDLVTFEEATGTVEDIRLTYTYILTEEGTEHSGEPHDRRPARARGGVGVARGGDRRRTRARRAADERRGGRRGGRDREGRGAGGRRHVGRPSGRQARHGGRTQGQLPRTSQERRTILRGRRLAT
jgi:small-conductance mechanosensitive channel